MGKATDKQRMDWLESVSGKFYGVGYSDGDKVVLEWEEDDPRGPDGRFLRETIEHGVEADNLREAIDDAMKAGESGGQLKGTDRAITGRELRFAAENKLPVRYRETYHDPTDDDYDGVCTMEPASSGYYIGNSDIDPDDFKDDQEVSGDFPEGIFAAYAIKGVDYESHEVA